MKGKSALCGVTMCGLGVGASLERWFFAGMIRCDAV